MGTRAMSIDDAKIALETFQRVGLVEFKARNMLHAWVITSEPDWNFEKHDFRPIQFKGDVHVALNPYDGTVMEYGTSEEDVRQRMKHAGRYIYFRAPWEAVKGTTGVVKNLQEAEEYMQRVRGEYTE